MMTMRALVIALVACLLHAGDATAAGRQGIVVVARGAAVVEAAASLARAAYQDRRLRPELDESTVAAVLGLPAPDASARVLELGRVARAAVDAADPAIGARLLRGLGSELGTSHVVVVDGTEASPTARVFVVEDGRFLPLLLAPRAAPASPTVAPAPARDADWSDAVLLLGAAARPSLPAKATVAPAPLPAPRPLPGPSREPGKPSHPLLSSGWFWGSLAAVVSVGLTVLIVSHTTGDSPGTVRLDGRLPL
ncbi:MAG: hypothetical protein FJ096_15620 [Deltaproteobacteria bacterium]|nr:hypothetical protein [Deltaproteobacteria bacterium]